MTYKNKMFDLNGKKKILLNKIKQGNSLESADIINIS